MLDTDLKARLRAYLERVTQPVELIASVDDGAPSVELLALLRDVAEQSDRVTLAESRGDAERKPSFLIRRAGGDAGGVRAPHPRAAAGPGTARVNSQPSAA